MSGSTEVAAVRGVDGAERGGATGWLDPVRAALDAADAPCPVFFRDDDAGWGDDRLYSLLDLFDRHGLPVDVAVIPAELRPPLVRELTARAASAPVHLHQHGYAHLNHEPVGRKCEFGTSRDAYAQAADIEAGRRILAEAFGPLLEPVFTPPWNRCTEATGTALVALGVQVLSRDATAPRLDRPDLAEVPVTVDWFGHRRGVRFTRAELGFRIAEGVAAGGPVGVMLHHAVTDEAEQAGIAELLSLVAGHPHTRSGTIAATAALPAAGSRSGDVAGPHMSRTTSVSGRAQQMSTWPSGGGSSGSGE